MARKFSSLRFSEGGGSSFRAAFLHVYFLTDHRCEWRHNTIAKPPFFLAVIFIAARLFAQTPTTLTMVQAMSLAQQNSLILRIADRELEKSTRARSELAQ